MYLTKKKGFTVIEGVIIVVLVLVAIGIFSMSKKKAAPTTTSSDTATTIDTTAWKTYSSQESLLSISFKYPNDWLTDESRGSYQKIYKTNADKSRNYILFDTAGGSGDTSEFGDETAHSKQLIDDTSVDIVTFTHAKFAEHGGVPGVDYFSLGYNYLDADKKDELIRTYEDILSTLKIQTLPKGQ
ncbi:MAG: PsbP-related protein [bacterium]|nr:PsbP-related protein [bacterium]